MAISVPHRGPLFTLSRPTTLVQLRAIVEEHRQRGRDALTLTGPAVQIDQLRTTLDALATKVRRHEEALRHLRRRSTREPR
jgi:hypothetical protein